MYFDLFGRWLVHYPVAWAIPLALLAVALFVGVTVFGLKHGAVSPGQIILGWLAWGAIVLIVGMAFRYGLELVGGHSGGTPAWFGWSAVWPYWFVAVGLTVAVSAAVRILMRRWLTSAALALGALFWWLILAVACPRDGSFGGAGRGDRVSGRWAEGITIQGLGAYTGWQTGTVTGRIER